MTRSWRWLSIVLCAAAIGCDRSSAPPVAKAKSAPPAAVVKADVPKAAMPAAGKKPDSPEKAKTEVNPKVAATGSPKTVKKSDKPLKPPAKSESKAEPPKPERIAVFTPGGPLLIDVTMTLDGSPYNQAFDNQLAELLKAADTDDDGVATWQELMDNSEYLRGGVEGQPSMNARQKRDAIKQYDLNEDGHVQKQEATAWLGRDAGRSAAAFRVRSSRAYVPNARTHSRVWPFLDRDGNGGLSAAELASAGDALLRLDADDDQVLTLDELASLREQLLGQNQMNAANDATRDAAIHLEPGYTIERLDYILPDLYSPRQALSPESFSALPKLFEQLDKSGEEWLDRDELARLLTIEPHVKLAVEFTSAPTAEQPAAKVTLLGLCDEVEQVGASAPDQFALALGETRLAVSATGAPSAIQPAMPYGGGDQNQLQLVVHDQEDTLFEELDANGDGRLGTREMTDGAKRLAARDANGDGALTINELPYSMVVAFARGGLAGEGFYTPQRNALLAEKPEAPAWFQSADFNGDGDVSRREFLGEAARFDELDGDGNGFIDAKEAVKAEQTTPPAPPVAAAAEAPISTSN